MVLEFISVCIGVSGLVFGLYQYYAANKVRRSEILSELIFKLGSDEEIRSAIYLFEYDNCWFNGSFRDSETEIKVDKTLQYLSYICYLYEQRIIKKNEFNVFEYEIARLFQNDCTIDYFNFLKGFSEDVVGKRNGKAPFPFQDLLDFGIENGYIDSPSLQ